MLSEAQRELLKSGDELRRSPRPDKPRGYEWSAIPWQGWHLARAVTTTVEALISKGVLDGNGNITEAGRKALEKGDD